MLMFMFFRFAQLLDLKRNSYQLFTTLDQSVNNYNIYLQQFIPQIFRSYQTSHFKISLNNNKLIQYRISRKMKAGGLDSVSM